MTFKTKKAAREYLGVGLSSPGKMPCPSWSLPPRATCITGGASLELPNAVCSSCYACKGTYTFPVVKSALTRRLEATKKRYFVDAMVKLIEGLEYFRWHDSGDLYSPSYFTDILAICRRTPGTQHWLPTREAELVNKYAHWEHSGIPANLTIRISGLQVDTPIIDSSFPTSDVMTTRLYGDSRSGREYRHCPATWTDQEGCDDCRACWNKEVDIVYRKH